jgi:hypothetical protein
MTKKECHKIYKKTIDTNELIPSKFCEICSAEKVMSQLSGHHFDYDKPLQVIWCCQSCHSLIHIYGLHRESDPEIIHKKLLLRSSTFKNRLRRQIGDKIKQKEILRKLNIKKELQQNCEKLRLGIISFADLK